MQNYPHIIEFCGIPYSRKTSTIQLIAKQLRKHGKEFCIIEEFHGSDLFYNEAKHTPDLNIARILDCLHKIITFVHSKHCKIILIDRGAFDTYCWLSWFHQQGKVTIEQLELSKNLLSMVKQYSKKNHIIWMDFDPILSIAQHGHQGKIINISNLSSLQSKYLEALEFFNNDLSIKKVSAGKQFSSKIIADRLISDLKLLK